MPENDHADRDHLQKLRDDLDEKGPVEAAHDGKEELKRKLRDVVSDDDDDDGDDAGPAEPSLDDEPRVDESDEGRALPGDRPSERTKSGFNRK